MPHLTLQRCVYLLLAGLLSAPLLLLQGCGCGFDCNNDDDDDDGPALLTLSFSDALPEDLSEVVIELDTITLRRTGGNEVIDTFTTDAGEVNSLTIDLLEYRGVDRLKVLEDYEIATGNYSAIELEILDGDSNFSYVMETGSDQQLQLDTTDNFALQGFTARSGQQEYVIEFGLARALSQPDEERYLLSTEGVMVLNYASAATLRGQVDPELFNSDSTCSDKEDSQVGNRLYLYQAQDLDEETLVDVFTSASDNPPPGDATAPFAVTDVFGSDRSGVWEYIFGYLPAGDYNLAFACDSAGDDPVDYDELDIPLPIEQVYPLTLQEASTTTCNITPEKDCQ